MAGNLSPPLPVIVVASGERHVEIDRLPPQETLYGAMEAAIRAGYQVDEQDELAGMQDWAGTPAHVVVVRR